VVCVRGAVGFGGAAGGEIRAGVGDRGRGGGSTSVLERGVDVRSGPLFESPGRGMRVCVDDAAGFVTRCSGCVVGIGSGVVALSARIEPLRAPGRASPDGIGVDAARSRTASRTGAGGGSTAPTGLLRRSEY
jgi:hypothetical protein